MSKPSLERRLGLLGLTATGVCSMLGASVYIVPFMIQRNVEGIGPYVIPAFIIAAIPAVFAAMAYASLATSMPVAGGSYIYASRGLHPYLGFIASFSQWFGLSIVIGVIAYVIIPFVRDAALAVGWNETASLLSEPFMRITLAMILLWSFVLINIIGISIYEKILIPLMVIMFLLGAIVIIVGAINNHESFTQALYEREGIALIPERNPTPNIKILLSASAVLFASFIGFDSISQAGSEAKNPNRNLPLAIGLTIFSVGTFYFLFTSSVYHTVPWYYVHEVAMKQDATAPGLLSPVLPPTAAALIILGAAIALLNDLPAMLLSVSRLMFAWSEDKIFPSQVSKVHRKFHTPHVALIISGVFASIGIMGSYLAGDFFMGVDIMVTSMLVNFLLMCLTLISINRRNQRLADKITFIKSSRNRMIVGWLGTLILACFLIIHSSKDLAADKEWYFKSTPIWLIVMAIASLIYYFRIKTLRNNSEIDVDKHFKELPG